MSARVVLKKNRDKSLRNRHPWVFSGSIAAIEGQPASGETVMVRSVSGAALGWGAYSPASSIAVRMWTFDPDETVDDAFFQRRLEQAIALRASPALAPPGNAARLVFSEADGLPGLIADRYGDFLVAQFLSAGAERWKKTFADMLQEITDCRGVYERSDADARDKEGLPPIAGSLLGEEPPERIEIQEGELRFLVDPRSGHKTGFYLDQRENRLRLMPFVAGLEILDCFCYTGGFGITALRAGAAAVTSVDSSAPALNLLRENAALNGVDHARLTLEEEGVPQLLRRYGAAGRRFDVVILDPPKFARAQNQLERAGRAYKDLNRLALQLLRPGGMLFTFSCSQLMTPEDFQRIVAFAALDAGRETRILLRLRQSADHSVPLNFPEAEYLKGLACRVS